MSGWPGAIARDGGQSWRHPSHPPRRRRVVSTLQQAFHAWLPSYQPSATKVKAVASLGALANRENGKQRAKVRLGGYELYRSYNYYVQYRLHFDPGVIRPSLSSPNRIN